MEVQDLNNLINMPNFTKGSNSSQDLLSSKGVDFASLLGGKDTFAAKENASHAVIESGLKSKGKTIENTNHKDNYSKPVAKTQKDDSNYKSADAKKSAGSEKAVAKDTVNQSSAEAPADIWNQPYANEVDVQDMQLVDENGNIVSLYNEEGKLNLEALAYVEGLVSFINPETGEEQTLSIEDFTKKIISGELPLLTMEDVVEIVNKEGLPLIGMEPVKDKEVFAEGIAPDTETEVATKDKPADVKKFDEIIVDDETISVKVDVKEEKIALSTAKPLVVEAKPFVDVVEKTDAKQVVHQASESSPTAEVENTQTQASADVNSQADINAVDAPEVSPAGTNVKTEVNAATLSQTVSASVNTAGLSRTDTLSENNRLSTQDIYKGLGKEAVEQVKVNIMKSAVKGVDKIEIQLKPQELGNVEVKLQIGKDGKLTAQIITSRAETADILQKDMQSLEKAFNDAGFKTGDGALSFTFRDEANQNNEKNSGLRAFMGNVLEENTDLPTNYSESSWDGKSALNIRV